MAVDTLQLVRLKDDFYRDGFYKVIIALALILTAIVFLMGISIYLYTAKPLPVRFRADNEWRILAPVPLDQQYLSVADLIQWVSQALPSVFIYDFVSYPKQLKETAQYFTTNGWQKFLDQVNVYANYNAVQNSRLFISSSPAGAPFILNQGVIDGKYSWWVQMPVNLSYYSPSQPENTEPLVIQVLVMRVPTLNNLSGVGIENIVIRKGGGDQVRING